MNLCGCDREESEYGVGAVVNPTKLVETIQFVGLVEGSAKAFRLRKKTMNLCPCDSEDREHGLGTCKCYCALRNTTVRRTRRRKSEGYLFIMNNR